MAEENTCTKCKTCLWSSVMTKTPAPGYSTYRCMHKGNGRFITVDDINKGGGFKPLWCPLAVASAPKRPLTYSEKNAIWEKMPPKVKYEDIEVGARYHVPPFSYNTDRYDIVIKSKTTYSVDYVRIINGAESSYKYSLYPTTPLLRYMVKSMLD